MEPADLERLVVAHVGVPAAVVGDEVQVQVLGTVTIGMDDRRGGAHRCQRAYPGLHPGLLEDLALDGGRRLLTWFGDAADDRPLSGVRAPAEEDLPILVEDDGAQTGQPEQVLADSLS